VSALELYTTGGDKVLLTVDDKERIKKEIATLKEKGTHVRIR
jgi:hypothetical protein